MFQCLFEEVISFNGYLSSNQLSVCSYVRAMNYRGSGSGSWLYGTKLHIYRQDAVPVPLSQLPPSYVLPVDWLQPCTRLAWHTDSWLLADCTCASASVPQSSCHSGRRRSEPGAQASGTHSDTQLRYTGTLWFVNSRSVTP